jgi:hypothetical protein
VGQGYQVLALAIIVAVSLSEEEPFKRFFARPSSTTWAA